MSSYDVGPSSDRSVPPSAASVSIIAHGQQDSRVVELWRSLATDIEDWRKAEREEGKNEPTWENDLVARLAGEQGTDTASTMLSVFETGKKIHTLRKTMDDLYRPYEKPNSVRDATELIKDKLSLSAEYITSAGLQNISTHVKSLATGGAWACAITRSLTNHTADNANTLFEAMQSRAEKAESRESLLVLESALRAAVSLQGFLDHLDDCPPASDDRGQNEGSSSESQSKSAGKQVAVDSDDNTLAGMLAEVKRKLDVMYERSTLPIENQEWKYESVDGVGCSGES